MICPQKAVYISACTIRSVYGLFTLETLMRCFFYTIMNANINTNLKIERETKLGIDHGPITHTNVMKKRPIDYAWGVFTKLCISLPQPKTEKEKERIDKITFNKTKALFTGTSNCFTIKLTAADFIPFIGQPWPRASGEGTRCCPLTGCSDCYSVF